MKRSAQIAPANSTVPRKANKKPHIPRRPVVSDWMAYKPISPSSNRAALSRYTVCWTEKRLEPMDSAKGAPKWVRLSKSPSACSIPPSRAANQLHRRGRFEVLNIEGFSSF